MGVKISELTSAGTLAGTEKIPCVDSGTQYTTPADMKAYMLTSATSQATTSGTSKDFTGIPSTVKRITVMLDGVSTSGASQLIIQIGDSGGIETSGYVSGADSGGGSQAATDGYVLYSAGAATYVMTGSIVLTLLDSSTNTWACSGAMNVATGGGAGSGYTAGVAGGKSLSSTLDRVRLTTQGGADTFDAGKVNILYE